MLENVSNESVDLRIKRSRKYLIEALLSLMQEKPFQKITVQDITARAMVNRSTFYAHFVDKYDLFSSAMGHRIRQDFMTNLGNSTGFNGANLRTLVITAGSLMMKTSNDCTPTPVNELIPLIMTEMQTSIYEIVLTWTNTLNTTTDSERVAMFTAGAIFGSVTLWGQHASTELTIEELADQIMPMLMEGVRHCYD